MSRLAPGRRLVPARSCWLCGRRAPGVLYAPHYETGELVWFCTYLHYRSHQQLAAL